MSDVLLGMILGALWVLWAVVMWDWWQEHVDPYIAEWVRRQAERRLVRTGHWTDTEAAEIVAGWGRKNGSDRVGGASDE